MSLTWCNKEVMYKIPIIYLLVVFDILMTIPETKGEWRAFALSWLGYLGLVIIGGIPRVVYNKHNQESPIKKEVVKVLSYSLFACFIAKMLLESFEISKHELWVIPLVAFSCEIIVTTWVKGEKNIIERLIIKLQDVFNPKK